MQVRIKEEEEEEEKQLVQLILLFQNTAQAINHGMADNSWLREPWC